MTSAHPPPIPVTAAAPPPRSRAPGAARRRSPGRVDEDPLGPVHLWTLVIFAVVSLGLTGLLTWLTLNALSNGRRGVRASGIVTDPVTSSSAPGLGWASLPSACWACW